MADALPLTPLLLIVLLTVAAAAPAIAQPLTPRLKLHPMDMGIPDEPANARRAPVFGNRLFLDDRPAVPTWTLPFGLRAADRGNRGFTFSIRPNRVKATARIRF